MHVVVTGGAGFIGSNLVDQLLDDGHTVTAVDNLSTGSREFLVKSAEHLGFEFVEMDLLDERERLREVVRPAEAVFHLAANADVRYGWHEPERDLRQNVMVTHNVLEAMRITGVQRLLFASTASVYGEAAVPTPEDCPFPVQTSLYGASKLGAEALIQAYSEGVGFRSTIARFVSVLGARYTHGHVIDFVRSLRSEPTLLTILGDGTQRKSYLEVTDCVAAMTSLLESDRDGEAYNLGVDDSCSVLESANWICERLGVTPRFEFTGGDRGWIGDNPHIHLDTAKLQSTGWRPRYSIREAIERTVDFLVAEPWVLERPEARALP
jgi:UDP-glucose 4-epimerase